jgi:ABC-type Fe3+-hydroxamate transport system substrate-binding protein
MFLVVLVLCVAIVAAMLTMRQSGHSQAPVFRAKPATPPVAAADSNAPYFVEMSPAGRVKFDHPPRRVVTLDANYNEILVTLGVENRLIATGSSNNFFDGFFQQISSVTNTLDSQKLTYLYGASGTLFDKETLYALHAEVHHIDPLQLASSKGWSQADVDEIAHNVGPFLANRYSREISYPGKAPYTYYNVWELSDKIAQVYRRPLVIARLQAIGKKLVDDIQAKLPPLEKRPRVGLVVVNANGRYLPFSLVRDGFGQAQYRAIGARDAFESIAASTYADAGRGTPLDLEGLLSLDPDVLIVPWAIYTSSRSSYEKLQKLESDPLGGRLTAVRHHRVYPGGTPLQGPVFFLFQIEMAAKQIYPECFGPYRDDQHYPPAEQLFDRAAVAAALKDDR